MTATMLMSMAASRRTGLSAPLSCHMLELSTAYAPVASAATTALERLLNARQGRLARTIPASSRTWPRPAGSA